MITEIHQALWRISRDEELIGWVQLIVLHDGEHRYRARRLGHRGLGASLGEYPTLDTAADALLNPLGPPAPDHHPSRGRPRATGAARPRRWPVER